MEKRRDPLHALWILLYSLTEYNIKFKLLILTLKSPSIKKPKDYLKLMEKNHVEQL